MKVTLFGNWIFVLLDSMLVYTFQSYWSVLTPIDVYFSLNLTITLLFFLRLEWIHGSSSSVRPILKFVYFLGLYFCTSCCLVCTSFKLNSLDDFFVCMVYFPKLNNCTSCEWLFFLYSLHGTVYFQTCDTMNNDNLFSFQSKILSNYEID
jgi:hypothetical protein